MACVYELTFPSGKRYIGITNNFVRRWAMHKHRAKSGSMLPVHAAIRKYGTTAVVAKILIEGAREYVAAMEKVVIEAYRTLAPRGYNVALGGEQSPALTPTVKEKIRQSKLRHWADPEYRARMIAHSVGRVMTPEQNEKTREAKLRHWADPAYREKVSAAHRGKKQSAETVRAKSEASQKAWADPARAARGREVMLGRKWINDGATHRQIGPGDEVPEGWARGMLRRVA